jgi:hypothetical protein
MAGQGRLTPDEQQALGDYEQQQAERGLEADPEDPWYEDFANQVEERLLEENAPPTRRTEAPAATPAATPTAAPSPPDGPTVKELTDELDKEIARLDFGIEAANQKAAARIDELGERPDTDPIEEWTDYDARKARIEIDAQNDINDWNRMKEEARREYEPKIAEARAREDARRAAEATPVDTATPSEATPTGTTPGARPTATPTEGRTPSGEREPTVANPRNKDELAVVIENFFKLSKAQARAVAEVADRIIATMALRRGMTLEDAYLSIAWQDSLTAQQAGMPVPKTAKGATVFIDQARTIVAALTNPDVSTPLHELAHVFEQWLTPAERRVIMEYAGTKRWSRDTSEAFAEAFEAYLRRGRTGVPAKLRDIFDKFARWINTYASIVRNLSPQMEEIFGRILSEGEDFIRINKAAEQLPAGHYLGGDLKVVDRDPTVGDYVQYKGKRWFVVAPGVLVSANMKERITGVNMEDIDVLDINYTPAREGDTVFYDGVQATVSFAGGKITLSTPTQKIRVEDNALNRKMLDAAKEMNKLRDRFDKARAELERIVGVSVPGAYPRAILFQVNAWHGSPYIFDKFKLHAIGTGEGAQVYGWGLYVSTDPKVATGYRNSRNTAVLTVDGKSFEEDPDVLAIPEQNRSDVIGKINYWIVNSKTPDEDLLSLAEREYKHRIELIEEMEDVENALNYRLASQPVFDAADEVGREAHEKWMTGYIDAVEKAGDLFKLENGPYPTKGDFISLEENQKKYKEDYEEAIEDAQRKYKLENGSRAEIAANKARQEYLEKNLPPLPPGAKTQHRYLGYQINDLVVLHKEYIIDEQRAAINHMTIRKLAGKDVKITQPPSALYRVTVHNGKKDIEHKWFRWFEPVNYSTLADLLSKLPPDPPSNVWDPDTPEQFLAEAKEAFDAMEGQRQDYENEVRKYEERVDQARNTFKQKLRDKLEDKLDDEATRLSSERINIRFEYMQEADPRKKQALKEMLDAKTQEISDYLDEKARKIQSGEINPPRGRWYEEAINELSMDIKEAYDEFKPAHDNFLNSKAYGNLPTNERLYKFLSIWLGGPRFASEFLQANGYDGVKYPTNALMRTRSDDHHNYVIFDDEAIQINERINFENDQEASRTLFQIAGANANMDPDMAAWYDKANLMDQAGVDQNIIKRMTNWERGADGKWRYELDDVEVDMDTFNKMSDGFTTLGAIVKDDKGLFDKYPQLRGVMFHKYSDATRPDLSDTAGYYLSFTNTIGVSSDNTNVDATLAHELAHLIQKIEGFTEGGNQLSALAKMPKAEKDALVNQYVDGRQRAVTRISDSIEEYKKLPVPSRPALVELRDKIRAIVSSSKTYKRLVDGGKAAMNKLVEAKDAYSQAVIDFVDNLMTLGLDDYPSETYDFNNDDFHEKNVGLLEKLGKMDDFDLDYVWKDIVSKTIGEWEFRKRELQSEIKTLVNGPGIDRDSILFRSLPDGVAHKLYLRLGGEVEARNVERRRGMTAEQRRNKSMASTEDIARPSQILFQTADADEPFEPNEHVKSAISKYADSWISLNQSLSFTRFWNSLPAKVQRQMDKDQVKQLFEGTPGYSKVRDMRRERAEGQAEASFGNKQSKGGRSIVDKTAVDQAVKDEVTKKGIRYFAEPMNQSEQQILMWLDAIGTDEATKAFLTNETELPYHLQAFLGIELLKRLNGLSKFGDAAQVAVHLARLGTSLGRGVNAFKALTFLTPEGIQIAVSRIIEKAYDGLRKKYQNRISRSIDKYKAAKAAAGRSAQSSTLRDKEWLKEAKADVERRLAEQKGGSTRFQTRFTPTGLDPKMVPLMVEYGIYTALEGNTEFKTWATKMRARFGLTDAQALEIWDHRPVNGVFSVREIGNNAAFISNVDTFAWSEEAVKAVLENYGIYSSAVLAKRIYNSFKRDAREEFNKNATKGEKAFVQALDWGDEAAATDLITRTWAAGAGFQGLDQELQDLIDKTNEILTKSPTYAMKEAAIKDLMALAFRKVGREPIGEYVSMMMYYNMLSSPGTHLANIMGNLFQTLGDTASTLFAPILDLPGVRAITGSAEMKVAPQYRFSTGEKLRAAKFGLKLGLKNARDIIKTGRLTQIQGQKYEIPNLQERYRFASDVMAHLSQVLPNLKRGKPAAALNDILKAFFGGYALMAKYNSRLMDAEDAIFRTPTMVSYYVTASEQLASREVTEKGDLYQEVLNDLQSRGDITGDPNNKKNREKIRAAIADRLRGWAIGDIDTTWKQLMDQTRNDLQASGLPFSEQDVINGAMERFPSDFRVKDIAERRANRAVFRFPPEGTVGAIAVSLNDFIRKLPFGNNVVPFTNLLANLFNTWLDYLPPVAMARYYGFTLTTASNKMFGKSLPTTNIRGGGGFLRDVDEQILRRNELIWRGAVGLIFMTIAGMTLGGEDEEGYPIMTGQGPSDYKKKKELEARGVKWHSIRVPGIGYVSYSMLPIGLALSFVGNLFDVERYGNEKQKDMAWAAAVAGFPAYMLDIAFLSSLSDLIQTISNSERYTSLEKMNEAISRVMSKYIPLSAILNNAEASMGYDQPELLGWSSLLKSVPFVRQIASDKPALDHFGRPISKQVQEGILHNVWYHTIGTKRFYRPETELDPVEKLFMDKNYYTPQVSRQTEIGGVKLADDPVLYYEFFKLSQRFFKKQLDQTAQSYRTMPDDLFEKYMDKMHRKSRDIVAKMLTAGMHPDEIARVLEIQP